MDATNYNNLINLNTFRDKKAGMALRHASQLETNCTFNMSKLCNFIVSFTRKHVNELSDEQLLDALDLIFTNLKKEYPKVGLSI